MSVIPYEQPHFEEMNAVVEKYVQNINPTKIAKDMGLRRVDVLKYIEEWKTAAQGAEVMRDRVQDLITSMDEHYSQLIRAAYSVIDEVDAVYANDDAEAEEKYTKKWGTMSRAQMLSQKMNAIKTIADLESKRIDVLQRAGLLEAADFGDQLAAFEEEKETIRDIVKNHLCDKCRPKFTVALADRKKPQVFGEE